MLPLALAAASAASAAVAPSIVTRYETVVDSHVSSLMTLFLSDELNREWNARIAAQRLVQTHEYGQLVWQEYQLPWPLANRDVLLRCGRTIDQRAQRVTSSCESVEHPAAARADHLVRLVLSHTQWEITPLPGDRTRLSLVLELPASATAGLPKFVINYCQRQSLKDSVNELLAANERLKLPVHDSFIGWGRSRAATTAARELVRGEPALGTAATSWEFAVGQIFYDAAPPARLSASAVAALALAFALLQGGGFGVFCAYRRLSKSSRSSGWRALPPAAQKRVRQSFVKVAAELKAVR